MVRKEVSFLTFLLSNRYIFDIIKNGDVMKKILVVGLVGESVFMKCDHFHKKAETIIVDHIYDEIGGKGFNQALTIKQLGGSVLFISAVGKDSNGQKCIEDTNKLGLEHIYIEKDLPTAYATILTNKVGENQVSVFHGAKLERSDLPLIFKEVNNADIILLQLEIDQEITKEIIKFAKENKKTVILNPAPATKLIDEYLMCDLLIPNEREVIDLFGENYLEQISQYPLKLIVTMGEKGSLLINNDVTAYNVEKQEVVDTTGAGDIFCGTIAYSLSIGETLDKAIKKANELASKSVQYSYVIPTILKL